MSGDTHQSANGGTTSGADVDVPTLLARLDDPDPDVSAEAVETVREVVENDPRRCLPTVPKLRELLEQSSLDCHESVAYCLAALAAVSPADVAPSTDAVVRFVRSRPSHPGRTHALRCLARIAEARPDTVVGHIDVLVDALEDADAGLGPAGVTLFATLSTTHPSAIEPATGLLEAVLENDPAPTVRDRAELALGGRSRVPVE
ncbi:hypothetical protein [Natrialbaceae archaeon AArc-T1-2]|uniref:hypothetical protein n=1 Tax=Natrialbaceae archaeon AArc-T1-2 TaxID=3053904 RepID=UPI00255AB365|nr:hypothetical protein [Natrialbaceae archaeon AArc-T1-2]WIV67444.1 hypothetical protein QQ977_01570 [Natrialbaceae archaeon AArc-T1-2]